MMGRASWKARMDEQVREGARTQLEDTRFDRLREPGARRVVATVYVLVMVVLALAWFVNVYAGVLALGVWLVAFLALRLSVRSVADLPDEVLDERLRRERDAAYLGAFRLVAGVLGAAVGALFIGVVVADANDEATVLTVGTDAANALFWTVFALVLGAPSLAMAWRRTALV